MSIWAAIKYAINSTLGKSNFEPLDKLIKNQKTLYASNDDYAVLYETEVSKTIDANSKKEHPLPISITMRGAGSFRLSYKHSSSTSAYINLKVIKNGEDITQDQKKHPSSTSYLTTTTSDYIFEDGDVFTFEYLYQPGSSEYEIAYKSLTLKGTIRENVFELKEV